MIPGLRHPSLDPNSEKPKVYCPPGSSKAKQTFKNECDINQVVRQFIRTGTIPETALNTRQAAFLDATSVPGYQECLDRINEAETAFQALPATIRERFNNNPGNLVRFIDEPGNEKEAQELGLLPKPEPTPPPTGDAKTSTATAK